MQRDQAAVRKPVWGGPRSEPRPGALEVSGGWDRVGPLRTGTLGRSAPSQARRGTQGPLGGGGRCSLGGHAQGRGVGSGPRGTEVLKEVGGAAQLGPGGLRVSSEGGGQNGGPEVGSAGCSGKDRKGPPKVSDRQSRRVLGAELRRPSGQHSGDPSSLTLVLGGTRVTGQGGWSPPALDGTPTP